MVLKIKRTHLTTPYPQYESPHSSALCFHAHLDSLSEGLSEYVVMPGEIKEIPLGLSVVISEGYQLQFVTPIELFKEGIFVNSDTLDSTNTDAIKVAVYNLSKKAFVIEPNDVLCKGILLQGASVDYGIIED